MSKTNIVGRRRVLQVMAAAGGACLLGGRSEAQPTPHVWKGKALGANASISLYHSNTTRASQLLDRCVTEINRLQDVFSLYRADSALSQLNRQGRLNRPPEELIDLLGKARYFSELTEGAFDITVQPLWNLYASHFNYPGPNKNGPNHDDILRALELVNYHAVNVSDQRVLFEQPGMMITLNGIAQGYITDKVTEILQQAGLSNVLVNLGENRALGHHDGGNPWRIGIRHPTQDDQLRGVIPLKNAALATSGGYGTPFDLTGSHHHLFDPASGFSANHYRDMTIMAPTACTADALSTGFSSMSPDQIAAIISSLPTVSAQATLNNGQVQTWV